ncbi:protein ASYMMETRIC LEAVES 2-like isoform X2 [Lotus japonicus]|nr:protein ASYMMETRIC LEAVES 2-like isoform X2 [Lotus japonicus]
MASSSSSPCAACKFLRRKCQPECVFAPYFPPDQPHKFASVHRIFGASNVSKLLNELQPHQREDAVNSLAYEAHMRLRDPINGCVGVISILHHQLRKLQMDLLLAKNELSKIQNFGLAMAGQNLAATTAAAAAANMAATAAATTIPQHMTNMSGGGIGGSGWDNYLHYHHHRHQFFPRDVVSNFDSGSSYEANPLAINNTSQQLSSFVQLNQLQLPSAAASVDNRLTTVHPSLGFMEARHN